MPVSSAPRAFRLLAVFAAATFLAGLAATAVEAHAPRYGVGTLTLIKVEEDRLLLFFDLSYDGFWAQGEMISMDGNRNSRVDRDEALAYLDRTWKERVAPKIFVKIDGEIVEPEVLATEHDGLVGEIYPGRFSLFYHLSAKFPGGPSRSGSKHELVFEDKVLHGETPGVPIFVIPFAHHGRKEDQRVDAQFVTPETVQFDVRTLSNVLEGERLEAELRLEKGDPPDENLASPWPWRDPSLPEAGDSEARAESAPVEAAGGSEGNTGSGRAGDAKTATPAASPNRSAASSSRDPSVELSHAVLRVESHDWWAAAGLLLAAVLWGIAHAFLPGHGKSMVAAYLSGTRGRLRDAVLLGGLTALTHTLTVLAIGAVCWIASATTRSKGSIDNVAVVVFSLLSGLFLVALGLILFFHRHRRLRHGLAVAGHHHHPHSPHTPTRQRVRDASERSGDDAKATPAFASDGASPDRGAATESESMARANELVLASGASFQCEPPRLRDMLALGFSGGIRPCPLGLAIVAIGLQYPDRFWIALLSLVFFSLGLGAVLVAVGVLMVTGKMLTEDKAQKGVFLQRVAFLRSRISQRLLARADSWVARGLNVVPVFSCLVVVALGAFVAVRSVRQGSTELLAVLDGMKSWLGL